MRNNFLSVIWRVTIGTLALSVVMIPVMKRAVYVAGKYSFHRVVRGAKGIPTQIISFRTQQAPVLHTLAQITVFEAYSWDIIRRFMDAKLTPAVRHGLAASFKATLTQATQSSLFNLAERCGAQGLFEYNHIIEGQLETRGISIAEGDTLVLCISTSIPCTIESPVPRTALTLMTRTCF